jgi:hypothetical protein
VAEEKLKQMPVAQPTPPVAIDLLLARREAARAAPNDPVEQERLFQRFLEWRAAQTNR